MSTPILTILVVGATGSVGALVVEEALREGHTVRALVRNIARAGHLPKAAKLILGDITRPETLADALSGVDAVIFTHGSNAGKVETEAVDYGAVRNILAALGAQTVRIALMTTIGVTDRVGSYNRRTEAHDWKRRAERLVRARGFPYTIVRPGWFDYNRPHELLPVLLQGDTRHAGDSSDGVIARRQIAQILVRSLTSHAALRKTFELVAAAGAPPADFDSLFAPLDADAVDALDGIRDLANMPADAEPDRVRQDMRTMRERHRAMAKV